MITFIVSSYINLIRYWEIREFDYGVILTREWYREIVRCVDATRRGEERHEGHFMDYPAQRLPDKAK